MTKKTKGLGVVQEGADFATAPDWQHVFDTRWRFMEVYDSFEMEVTVPSASPPASGSYWQKTEVIVHGLRFYPAFHGLEKLISGDPGDFDQFVASLYSTEDRIILAREVDSNDSTHPEHVYKVKCIVYNLPILEEYKSPVEPLQSYNLRPGKVGVRMLDGTRKDVSINENNPTGFAIDTTKRILSAHQTGVKYVMEYINQRLSLDAIDVGTDTFTYSPVVQDGSVNHSWVETGAVIKTGLFPLGTYPSPLETDTIYYIIEISDTEIQLASTESDAENGNQIDITDSGDLPVEIDRDLSDLTEQEDYEKNKIIHDIGYPPSFHIAEIARDNNKDEMLRPFKDITADSFDPIFNATDDYISTSGTQSVYAQELSYVIFKDPVEVAE